MRIGISLPVRELKDDLAAIRDFAQAAEELGFTHLRVPDQVIRPGSGHLHEPLTLLSWVAGLTSHIELVPSVIVLPERQTALVAKQAAQIDVLSGGRLRLGVGVGGSAEEFEALGADFRTRGRRIEEQIDLLRLLWTRESVDFDGEWDHVIGTGIDPLPVRRPIPIWIGPGAAASTEPVVRRIGRQADGWFAIVPLDKALDIQSRAQRHAQDAGRDPDALGMEFGVGIAGKPRDEWLARFKDWRSAGASHACIRTLGGELDAAGHLDAMRATRKILDGL